jgi:cytokinin dehydrogenase
MRGRGSTRTWTTGDLNAVAAETGVRVGAPSEREAAEVDFGRLVQGAATAMLAPRSATEVERIIAFANAHGLQLTGRGRGMSQGGQSIPAGGVSLDLSGLSKIDAPDLGSSTVRCGAGVTWRAVIARTAPHGLLPKVVPLNLDLTVGGLLSVAGVGATSHTYGTATACVAELDVVTGGGARTTCSEETDRAVYHGALGGLGRAGIIVAAGVELRPFKPRIRTFYLLYDAIEPWLRDQRALIASGRADYLEGFCTPCVQGLRESARGRRPFAQWFYALQVTVEYDPGHPPQASEVLRGLTPFRLVHTDDGDTVAFAARYDSRFTTMRKSGAWTQPHPWVEALLRGDTVHEILPIVLDLLPLALGDGPRLLFVNRRRSPPFLKMPDGPEVACCAILPVGIPAHILPDVLDALREVHRSIVAAGGKRVLSGWITMMDAAALRDHYGDQDAPWAATKQELDPRGVLDSPLLRADTTQRAD